MLKREITYESFDGEEITEVFYFNYTKTELIELQTSVEGGMQELITKIVKNEDARSMLEQMQKIIKMSYGQRSEDGKRFIKSKEMQNEFAQTAAYDALMMEFLQNENALVVFLQGILPKGLAEEIANQPSEALQIVRDADASVDKGVGSTKPMVPPPPPVL